MHPLSTLTREPRRRSVHLGPAAAAVAGVLLLVGGPALAVGTSGVDLTPLLPRHDDGSFVLTVEDHEPGSAPELLLTNLTDEPRDARVYAASAELRDTGGASIGGPGSVPWLALDESFQLGPDDEVRVPVEMSPRRADLDGGDHFIALVLEVSPSESLVTQAVSVIRVEQGGVTPLPAWPLILAAVLLVAAVLALLRFGRDTRRRGEVSLPA